ncbi:hypothetical protein C8R43DRAFT_961887 [Mycena crocata]|nr:hypothetical protein C8R43DRAFT_961887 [Mycena crocata]
MPQQSTSVRIRSETLIVGLTGAVETLQVLAESLNIPFLKPVAVTADSLLSLVPTLRRNKKDCLVLVEQAYQLICAIISFHIKPEIGHDLPPSTLNHLGKAAEYGSTLSTLHKITGFVSMQQEKKKIRWFFQPNQMNTLLKDCKTGVQQALDALKIGITNKRKQQFRDVYLLQDVDEVKKDMQDRNQEALRLIEELEDAPTSDQTSSVNEYYM